MINEIKMIDMLDYELIFVDDGSKDNSPKICDDYAKKDNRIKIINFIKNS